MTNLDGAKSSGDDPVTPGTPSINGSARLQLLKRWLPLALIAVLLIGGYALGLHRYLSFEAFSRNRDELTAFVAAHFWLAAAAYIGLYTLAVSMSFPGASFLTIAGGIIFGWELAGTMTVFAATIGASIIFLIARTAVGDLLKERAGPRLAKLRDGFNDDSFMYLLFLRLVPAFPFWLINIAPAFFGMRLAPYVTATAIGILPGTYAYAYFGQSLGTAVANGGFVPHHLVLGLTILAIATLIPILIKRWRKSRHVGT